MVARSFSADHQLFGGPRVVSLVTTALIVACSSGCSSSDGTGPAAASGNGGTPSSAAGNGSTNGGSAGVVSTGGVGGMAAAGAGNSAGTANTAGESGSGTTGGDTGSGGANGGTGGASAQGGSSGGAGGAVAMAGMGGGVAGFAGTAPLTGLGGSASRPQLSAAQSGLFTIGKYLARAGNISAPVTDNWDPTAGVTLPATPKYSVAVGGTYATVQSAVDAAVAAGGSTRVYIQLAPGTYTEQVCIKASAPPITLYSTSTDATQTVISHADFQGGLSTLGENPCGGDTNQMASTLDAFNAGFEAKNLTIQNSVTTAQINGNSASQAVALATTGDKVILDNVRVLSHQDTVFIDAAKNVIARVYAKNSYFAGDVDFIFGGSTAVFDHCTIQFLSDRKSSGQPLAPSTDNRNPYGFLVIGSSFTADAGTAAGAARIGRAWDHNCSDSAKDTATYVTTCVASGAYPNGQATVMTSTLASGYSAATPWAAAATSTRAYSSVAWACVGGTCPANRFYEYQNTGPGSAAGGN